MKLNIKRGKRVIKKEKAKERKKKKYTDLSAVIDKGRNFSMLYSGVEDKGKFDLLYDMGVRNFLISYHYVQKKKMDTEGYVEKGVKFFVDSGAYTFITAIDEQDNTIEDWEKYIHSYLKWVRKNKDIVFAIANLDLEFIVGSEQVQKWNEEFFEPFMLETGIPVCFVHHGEASLLSWEQYCKRYPYTGISWQGVDKNGNDFQYGFNLLHIAEKYDTVVHGMAMTNTSLLTKLPFYTVDSTTWLIGLQYGEVDYWTGRKMQRLKKDKWKGAYLDRLVALGFDRQKLLDEDMEEMIKVNVKAHQLAEEFVCQHLRSLMYWQKSKTQKRDSLEGLKFPSIDWCANKEHDGWEIYASAFNINTDDSNFATWAVINANVFIHWEEYKDHEFVRNYYTDDTINGLHTKWINSMRNSVEEKIEDLQKFYTECLLGEDDRLLQYGTNFDRTVKERDEYIDDTEYEYEDVPEMELQNLAAKFLPMKDKDVDVGMPEIDALDDEIFRENGIEPVRDSNGRFIKGQRQVLKPKALYSEKYPKLSCSNCVNAQKCPEYKDGHACAYNKMFRRYNSRDMGDIVQAMQGITDFSLERLQRAMLTETMNGGIPDPAVSQLMNQSTSLLNNLTKMYMAQNQEVIRQTNVVRADGTRETTTQVQSNPQGGGLLDKLFEGIMRKDEKKEKVVDAEAKEVTE